MERRYDTRQRESLLAFLEQHADQWLSARQIAEGLTDRQISLSAVYRNLARLEKENLVQRSARSGSREACFRFVNAKGCRDRLHMACVCCGRTFHMDSEHTKRMTRAMAALDGFDLDILNTVLYGRCSSCRAQ